MVMFTGLARVAREAGLVVRETSGWKTRTSHRGGMRAARGVLWHHTATAASAVRSRNNPTLNYMISGLGYPLANYGLAWDGSVDVIAAGTGAHAGKGVYTNIPRDQGNYYLIGIEVEGTTGLTWSNAQLEAAAKLGAQLDKEFGGLMHIGHYEYAPRRKVDPTGIPGNMPALRAAIKRGYWSTKTTPATTAQANRQATPARPKGLTVSEANRIIKHIDRRTTVTINQSTQDALATGQKTWNLSDLVELIGRRVGRTDGRVNTIQNQLTFDINESTKKQLGTGQTTWTIGNFLDLLGRRVGMSWQRIASIRGEVEGLKEMVKQLAEGEGVAIDYAKVEEAAKAGAAAAIEEATE